MTDKEKIKEMKSALKSIGGIRSMLFPTRQFAMETLADVEETARLTLERVGE